MSTRAQRRAWTRAVKNAAWRQERRRIFDRRLGKCLFYMSPVDSPLGRYFEDREREDRAAIRLRQELGVPCDDLLARLPVAYSWDDE